MDDSLEQAQKKTDECQTDLTFVLDAYTLSRFCPSVSCLSGRFLANRKALHRKHMRLIVNDYFNKDEGDESTMPLSQQAVLPSQTLARTLTEYRELLKKKTEELKSALIYELNTYIQSRFSPSVTGRSARFFANLQSFHREQMLLLIDEYFNSEEDELPTFPSTSDQQQLVNSGEAHVKEAPIEEDSSVRPREVDNPNTTENTEQRQSIIEAFDEYRDSVCQTLQEAANSGPSVSTVGGQDANNQEEMFGGVLENAQQRIVNTMNQTFNQPPPVLPFPVVSNITNQPAHVNAPGESAISQAGVNSGQIDDDGSLDVSIKREVDSSSESECESDTEDEEVQVKEEPNEEEEITGRSEEQTENVNNSGDNRKTNDSQNDNSNKAANEQESQAIITNDKEEANLEVDPNGPISNVVSYSSPPSSPSNAEQRINSFEFNSRFNDDNQIHMNENEIASDDDETGHVYAEDDGVDGDLEDDEHGDNMEIEENHLYDHQESDNHNESSMSDDDENDGEEESDQFEEQVNMSGVEEENDGDEYLMADDDSSDDTMDDSEEEEAALNAARPSTSTGRRSTPINVKKPEPLRVITKKLKCTVPGCKKVLPNKDAMNGHFLLVHKLKRYRCLVRRCYGKVSTSFATRAQYSDHRDQVHGSTTRWTCKCSKKFINYQELSTHYWKYHELGQFVCSMDGCTFKPTGTRSKVMHHLATHREAKYECPVDGCGKSFTQKGNLDKHRLIHTGERPFVCPECGKTFNRKGTLTGHLRIHRDSKCTWPQCAYSASDRSAVIAHIRMVHFKLPPTKRQQAEENIIDDRDARVYLAKV